MTRRDAERVRDETSGIGPGSSGRRDGVGTGRGTSHNSDAWSTMHKGVSDKMGNTQFMTMMIDALAEELPAFPGGANRMRCFTHILNLVVKVILCQFDGAKD